MGLFGDADLNELGISRHSMEDYLIKLLLLDESLRPEVPRLRELLLSLLGTMRGSPYTIPFDSSKELFQLAKPIIKHGFSDTGVVESLFGNANPNILRSVMDPLIDRLERAVDL